MRAPLHPAWVWLPPCAMLAALSLILASGGNRALFLRLNHAGPAIGGLAWPHLSLLGDGAIALAFVLPCIRRAPRCFWAALAALAIAGLWAAAGRQLLGLPSPRAVFDAGAFSYAGAAGSQSAFLSAHAAAASALAGVGLMGLAGNNMVRAALVLLAALAGLSRVMLGVQWPVGVLWDWLGGWLGAWTGLAMAGRWGWRTSGRAGLLAGVVLAGLSAGLLVRPLDSSLAAIPAAVPLQRLIAGACLVWGMWEMVTMQPRFSTWRMQRWRRWRRAGPGGKGGVIKRRATDG
jgi:hypothetical protein